MLSVQLAQFVFRMVADIRSVSTRMKLWDLTFRVDRNNVFGTLQFETRDRHEKIQMEGYFYTSSFISTHPRTNEATFYRRLESEIPLPDYTVREYMEQINESLRCVQFQVLRCILLLTISQRVNKSWPAL